MDVGALLRDALAGVAGAAHDGDLLAGLDGLAGFEARLNRAQVRVERANLQAFNLVAEDDVFAVI